MKRIVTYVYLPLFLVGGNGLAIYLVENDMPKYGLIALGLGLIALSFFFERVAPYRREFNVPQNDGGRDTIHALVNEALNIVGWLVMPFLSGYFNLVNLWPQDWPLVFQLILAVLIADVGITLAHYASHRNSSLWRLHAVHHSVTRMYGFNGLMKHPLHQLIETLAGVFPLLLIGVTSDVLALLIMAVVIQLLLQHSNVNYACGPLKYLLAINQVHRFHHLSSAKEGNVNFGFFTTITDRFLGTTYYDSNRQIGVADLGIETERDYPRAYLDQLVYPFQSRD